MKPFTTVRLALVFLVAVAGWVAVQTFGIRWTTHPLQSVINRADDRAQAAYAVVDSVKRARDLPLATHSQVRWRALLGEDYTPMTTTLGSLSAKEVASNPAWAGTIVRLLAEAGVGRGDTVGIMASGSFPGLTLATLAAVQELAAQPKLVVSLGASSFGANSRLATWLDLQAWVVAAGVLDSVSSVVTLGAEDDTGGGLSAEGMAWLREALRRHDQKALVAENLRDAMAARLDYFGSGPLAAVVNIGGGQAALGSCPHAPSLPAGRWPDAPTCVCEDRGVLSRLHKRGIPTVNLLSIRELALKYGLDPEPGAAYRNPSESALVRRADSRWVLGALLAVTITLMRPSWRRTPPS